ncbi:UPF0223 family protein [Cytobacillus firmus]|uniref:UPF0223 family protein n=1 Tax=Cytobacillus firmus TaxID=1399 RepID=UPI0018CEE0EA|nr:UPF0223 family protein [Cytobacillus firmus]MBG9589365.1 hypothetical protein [Cytobacillus firmus]
MEYQYPIDQDWSTEEIVDVIKYFESIEMAYEKGIEREQFMNAYRRFKEIVPGKAQEKNICDDFEEQSGYSSYRIVKLAKERSAGDKLKMQK